MDSAVVYDPYSTGQHGRSSRVGGPAVREAVHFFGRRWGSWHRRQRVCCELILPPHFGQRRLFSFMVNVVRGRMPMMILTPILGKGRCFIEF